MTAYAAWLDANEWNPRREALLRDELTEDLPLISVVVPHGRGRRRTLRSIAAQVYRAHEVLATPDEARGDLVAHVEPGDVLAPDALAEIALASGDADAVYTDEDELDRRGRRSSPQFKPDWSPELQRSYDYVGGLLAARRGVAQWSRVAHVPRVLYHRRRPRRIVPARSTVRDEGPSVAVVIPTRDQVDLLARCLASLARTTYRDYQVVVVDNDSADPAAIAAFGHRTLRISTGERFDFARLVNEAVRQTDAELMLFLNNDTEVLDGAWLSQLVAHAVTPGVGAVGARLLFPNRTVQHAGVVHGVAHGLAGHAFAGLPADEAGYLSYAVASRNCAAVTGACLLTPRALFCELGGFDEERFPVSYNDVDYCHRLVDAGHRIVYCAEAELLHHEGVSRGRNADPHSPAAYRALYGDRIDRFYNPNLSLADASYRIAARTLPPRTTARAIPTFVDSDDEELVARLAAEGVVEVVARDRAEVALGVAPGVPFVWQMQRDFDPSLARTAAKAYQLAFDADATRVTWPLPNTVTVPLAIDVRAFRATLVDRADARAELRIDDDEVVAVSPTPLGNVRAVEPGPLAYSAADLAVCPEAARTYSRPILRAMAAGLPVIAPEFPEVSHEVSRGVNSLQYAAGGLDAAVDRLIADRGERARLARNSSHVLAALPDFESRVRAYASLLREAWLVGRPRR